MTKNMPNTICLSFCDYAYQ